MKKTLLKMLMKTMEIKLNKLGNMSFKSHQKAVTLTELSVSIAIISLLIAGTFGGMSMLKAAKIHKVVNEFSSYMSAINEFQSQYGYLPGDLPTASSYWSGAHDGTGDSIVDGGSATVLEDLYVWEHLSKAKLISGSYTGVMITDPTVRYGAGTNAPNSEPFTIGLFGFYSYYTSVYNTSGNILRLGAVDASGQLNYGVLSAKDAYSIDVKIDDGLASSGLLYAVRYATNCTSADYTAASATYNLSDTTIDCKLFYYQKKF